MVYSMSYNVHEFVSTKKKTEEMNNATRRIENVGSKWRVRLRKDDE